MKELSVGKIRRSLKQFEDFANDLSKSDMNAFNDRLRVLMKYCKSDPVLCLIHTQLISMPGVNFDSWYKNVLSTVGGMVGSGDLTFPTNLERRMAMMYQLLNKIYNGEIEMIDFAIKFFVTSDTHIDSIIYAFNDAVVEPLTRALSYRIKELEEEMPGDDRETYPLANIIQIILSAENVVQQSASGRNIQQNAKIKHSNELKRLFNELRDELRSTIKEKEELENAMQIVRTSEELAQKSSSNLPSVKVLLDSLGALGSVGSIVSAILTTVAGMG